MKIAAYNVENLFDRPRAFEENTAEATRIVKQEAEFKAVSQEKTYTPAVKQKLVSLLTDLGLAKADENKYVILRRIRGPFLKRPASGPVQIIANGRADWIGWTELKTAPVNEIAILNTGRVIRDVDADILAVVEAEDRIALKQFCASVLTEVGGKPYPNVMLIDGNDDRGIDVGLLTKAGYTIGTMRSHVHDAAGNGYPIFSRDCPEYCVTTPNGETIWVLPNHFKSKFGGDTALAKAKRKAQATRTAAIYNTLKSSGEKNIVVLGDLNDVPTSDPLQPLLTKTDLKEITAHPTFNPGEYKGIGTYGLGNNTDKIDYLLLSPALYKRITACGLFRKGAWPGARPRWTVYPELEKEVHVASDHHVVWCELT